MLQLVDDGKLTVDQTIGDAAPEVAKKYPQVVDRTIQSLLGMSFSICDYLNPPVRGRLGHAGLVLTHLTGDTQS